MCGAVCVGCAAAKFQAQQARQAGLDAEAGGGVEAAGTGSPRLNAQQRLSSMGGAAAMSAAAPSDVTGICGTGYYISVSTAPHKWQLNCVSTSLYDWACGGAGGRLVVVQHPLCHGRCFVVAQCPGRGLQGLTDASNRGFWLAFLCSTQPATWPIHRAAYSN